MKIEITEQNQKNFRIWFAGTGSESDIYSNFIGIDVGDSEKCRSAAIEEACGYANHITRREFEKGEYAFASGHYFNVGYVFDTAAIGVEPEPYYEDSADETYDYDSFDYIELHDCDYFVLDCPGSFFAGKLYTRKQAESVLNMLWPNGDEDGNYYDVTDKFHYASYDEIGRLPFSEC